MSYGEWCPTCGEKIVKVTRGIPSMGLCEYGHETDRREVLRHPPAVRPSGLPVVDTKGAVVVVSTKSTQQ